MGMDLGYDPTGLKDPPTPHERYLAIKILGKALNEVKDWPGFSATDVATGNDVSVGGEKLKQVCVDVFHWCRDNPGMTASDAQLELWQKQAG
jgi:hypothetical protein